MARALLYFDGMFDVVEIPRPAGKIASDWDEPYAPSVHDPFAFDPEHTTGDDDDLVDSDTIALRDAVRDIVALEGRFEVLMY
jgi:hypothetical protein